MKILFLQDDFPPNSFGGAAVVASNLAVELKNQGHQVAVITSVQKKSLDGSRIYQGLPVFSLYSDYKDFLRSYLSLYNPQLVPEIKAIVAKVRPDVVHAHNIHQFLSYHSLKIARDYGAKVFLTAHDAMLFHYDKLVEFIPKSSWKCGQKFDYHVSPWSQLRHFQTYYNPFRNLVIKHYLKYVDKIFAVSNILSGALRQNGIESVTIRNGIDPTLWRKNSKQVKSFLKRYELKGKKIVLFSGRLTAAKGLGNLVASMKDVVKVVPNAALLIIGQKNDYTHKVINEKGITTKFIGPFPPNHPDLVSAYHCAALVVTPSLYLDPFPTVNLEAMACKKPVIGTCLGGTPEQVKDGETGLIVNPFDINSLSSGIASLLTNKDKLEKFGHAGYKRVEKFFGLKDQVEETIRWYEQ